MIIDDSPIKHADFPQLTVELPEGHGYTWVYWRGFALFPIKIPPKKEGSGAKPTSWCQRGRGSLKIWGIAVSEYMGIWHQPYLDRIYSTVWQFGFVQMYGIPAAHDKYKTEWGALLQDSLTVTVIDQVTYKPIIYHHFMIISLHFWETLTMWLLSRYSGMYYKYIFIIGMMTLLRNPHWGPCSWSTNRI